MKYLRRLLRNGWEKVMYDKVLIVDDNINNVRLLQDILEDEGYEVYTLHSGIPVVEKSRSIRPDIILLDIMMPELDGFEVCKALKAEPELKDIPVIMVTAKVDGKDIKNALELGAIDYIKKPIDEDEVLARVGSALRQKQGKEDLREKASRDSLTGLYNHALLLEFLEKEVWQQERNNKSISFVMLDIDYFKKINDTYGHMAGDLVLKELSAILMKEIRSTDVPGRYGGEEFGIVLTDINKEDTMLLCERIRGTIEHYVFLKETSGIKATISIGFYFKTAEDRISCENMVKCADEALYKAKQNGRNRVEEYRI